MTTRLFTSESVTEGHPDKISDAVSDALLDAYLAVDPYAKVAIETLVATGQVHIVGEINTDAQIDIEPIVRETILNIGYDNWDKGFDGKTCAINVAIGRQSPDIAQGVEQAYEARVEGKIGEIDQQGAGDQGIMFGYATDETPEYLPLPIYLAHRIAFNLAQVRKNNIIEGLGPDGKVQVTIEYENEIPKKVDTIVISSQHKPEIDLTTFVMQESIVKHIITPVLQEEYLEDIITDQYRLLVNPTGKFVIGGPMGDAGLTGRKIIVDTYGGMSRHGGGAFSGKDPSKVDRSGAYALRWVAKNVVAAGLAKKIEIQVAYVIGKAAPVGLFVETFGTEKYPLDKIIQAIQQVFDMRPGAIIRDLKLLNPIYGKTSAYGHFGRRDVEFPWEQISKVAELQKLVNN